MNSEKKCNCGLIFAVSLAIIGSFLIVGALVWVMYVYTRPAPLGEDRAAVRRKTLADVRAADSDALDSPNYAWQDESKGIVRIPLKQAMDLSLRLWQDPAAARSNLITRVGKAFFTPPPPATKFD